MSLKRAKDYMTYYSHQNLHFLSNPVTWKINKQFVEIIGIRLSRFAEIKHKFAKHGNLLTLIFIPIASVEAVQ